MAVESPDFSFTRDPEERVRHLLSLDLPAGRDLILAGSSMGGYVAAVASRRLRPAGLFLMAPAFYLPGYEQDPAPGARLVEVLHGWRDDVVPVENSWRFARAHRARLHVIDADHALSGAMPLIEGIFRSFLADCR